MPEPSYCAIYVHIPFCRSKCLYCDFNSCAGREAEIPGYVEALVREIGGAASDGVTARTLYIGGGTPSLLSPAQVEAVVAACRERFGLRDEAEVTLEANPGTVDGSYLAAVASAGVNRLSLGVQSFDDGLLRFLGRIHTADEAREAVRLARAAGFSSVSLDLIYALPGQTEASWERDVKEALALAPEHLSLYALNVEEETPLAALVAKGRVEVPSADEAATLHEVAERILDAAGFEHYEISSWARRRGDGGTYRSRHNLAYWSDEPYLGYGAGAHSYFGGRRFWNESEPSRYVGLITEAGSAETGADSIDPVRGGQDYLMLGLRVTDGVDLRREQARYGLDVAALCASEIAELEGLGLLATGQGRLRLTRRGRLVANEVLLRLLPKLQAV